VDGKCDAGWYGVKRVYAGEMKVYEGVCLGGGWEVQMGMGYLSVLVYDVEVLMTVKKSMLGERIRDDVIQGHNFAMKRYNELRNNYALLPHTPALYIPLPLPHMPRSELPLTSLSPLKKSPGPPNDQTSNSSFENIKLPNRVHI
jgi:hypothetical protein